MFSNSKFFFALPGFFKNAVKAHGLTITTKGKNI